MTCTLRGKIGNENLRQRGRICNTYKFLLSVFLLQLLQRKSGNFHGCKTLSSLFFKNNVPANKMPPVLT